MQILGLKSKILLITVAIAMLFAIGASFAMWSDITVKATNEDLSQYANAKVGDIITFGNYYQTGNRINNDENAEYEKTPIEWIVVDKDERTGQLTLLSKYVLATGSYFGNWYSKKDYNSDGDYHYNTSGTKNSEVGNIPYNQAYVDSTVRAFLNNLERRDLGGDSYASKEFKTSVTSSDATTGKLLTSVGFSNRKYNFSGVEYQRPITRTEYKNRPATRGFYDEAFTDDEKSMIVPKVIPGYIGYRWPNNSFEPKEMSYVEGTVDKVWLPSTTELNIHGGDEYYIHEYTNPSDRACSTAFEYFKNYAQYTNPVTGKANITIDYAIETRMTDFVAYNPTAMNYSIPIYKYQSTEINTEIGNNSPSAYWTRTPSTDSPDTVFSVIFVGSGSAVTIWTYESSTSGVRPCVILKY